MPTQRAELLDAILKMESRRKSRKPNSVLGVIILNSAASLDGFSKFDVASVFAFGSLLHQKPQQGRVAIPILIRLHSICPAHTQHQKDCSATMRDLIGGSVSAIDYEELFLETESVPLSGLRRVRC